MINDERSIEYDETDLVEVTPTPDLNLSGVTVVKCKRPKNLNHQYYVFFCEPSTSAQECPSCGSRNVYKHGFAQGRRVVHDVNIGLYRTDIVLKVARYYCNECELSFRHQYEEIPERVHATNRLIEQIRQESLLRSFSEVADEFGYTEGTIRQIFDEYVEMLDRERGPIYAPRVLGIDEKHIAHKMRGVFVDIETGDLLEMTEDNKRNTMIGTIEKMIDYDSRIKIVTMDMANGYRSYVHECLPGARIIVDKFHIYQALYKRIKAIKTAIMSHIAAQIKNEIDSNIADEKTHVRNVICHNSYLFKYNAENITKDPKRLALMAEVCRVFPEFNHLRLLKEGFSRIYEEAKTKDEAIALYEEWKELIPPKAAQARAAWEQKYKVPADLYDVMAGFKQVIESWHEEIFGYFIQGFRFTNAATEGINRYIQAIDEKGSGYGFNHLRGKCIYSSRFNKRQRYSIKKTQKQNYSLGFYLPGGSRGNRVSYTTVYEVEMDEIQAQLYYVPCGEKG